MTASTSGQHVAQAAPHPAAAKSVWQKISESFYASVGDIVFGMEDGTVSIFGLVFGVAASSSSTAPVLLAGATGAVAAAVSMMAGAFLDVESERGEAQAELATVKARIAAHPDQEMARIRLELTDYGFTSEETDTIVGAFKRSPDLMMRFESDVELQISKTANDSPVGHAIWMFVSDLFALWSTTGLDADSRPY